MDEIKKVKLHTLPDEFVANDKSLCP